MTGSCYFMGGCFKLTQAKNCSLFSSTLDEGPCMSLPTQRALLTLWMASGTDFKEWSNPLHYELVGTFGSTYDIQVAANSYNTYIQTEVLAILSSQNLYLGLDIRIYNNGVSSDASVLLQTVGTDITVATPSEVAAVVHWQTAQPGGTGRGRTFWSGMGAVAISGGRVTALFQTHLAALATKLNTPHVDQGISWQLRLNSRKLNTYVPVSSFVVDALVGTQRRRRPRR